MCCSYPDGYLNPIRCSDARFQDSNSSRTGEGNDKSWSRIKVGGRMQVMEWFSGLDIVVIDWWEKMLIIESTKYLVRNEEVRNEFDREIKAKPGFMTQIWIPHSILVSCYRNLLQSYGTTTYLHLAKNLATFRVRTSHRNSLFQKTQKRLVYSIINLSMNEN